MLTDQLFRMSSQELFLTGRAYRKLEREIVQKNGIQYRYNICVETDWEVRAFSQDFSNL
jgi:hypothetical protein